MYYIALHWVPMGAQCRPNGHSWAPNVGHLVFDLYTILEGARCKIPCSKSGSTLRNAIGD